MKISFKKNLNLINTISVFLLLLYSVALVLFVNDTEFTYIENFFAYIVLLNFLIYIFLHNKFYFPRIYAAFAIFLLLSYIGLIFYPNDESYDLLISLFQIYIFSIVVCNILIFTNTSLSIEIGLIIGLLYSVFVGYYFGRDYFSGFTYQRYAGTLGNPNHYSFMLTVALLLLSRRFLILNNTIKIKRFYKSLLQIIIIVLILVICSEVIFFSMSRQGYLIVTLLLSYLFLQAFNGSNIFGKLTLSAISIYIAYFTYEYILTNDFLYRRVYSLFSLFNFSDENLVDYSFSSRTQYMSDAFNLWKQHPFFGVGLHQFHYVNQSGVSHNNFLELLANNGILGFIAYYALYFYFFLSYLRIKKFSKLDSNWLLVVLLMLIIADMTVLTYMEKPIWLIFSIVLFLIYSYRKDSFITIRL